ATHGLDPKIRQRSAGMLTREPRTPSRPHLSLVLFVFRHTKPVEQLRKTSRDANNRFILSWPEIDHVGIAPAQSPQTDIRAPACRDDRNHPRRQLWIGRSGMRQQQLLQV